jgi:Spy/CpxP family protein refolding chaperone
MMQTQRRWLLAVALFLIAAMPAYAQQPSRPLLGAAPQPFSWWKSDPIKKEVGLSDEQCARLDKIWETTRVELRQEWEELSTFEDKLSHLIQKDVDEAILARQIDRVETARASANKTRSLMLVQMRKVLTPDQRIRLDAIHARWLAEQPRPVPPTPPSTRDSHKKPED